LWIKDANGQILIKNERYVYFHVTVLVLSYRPKERSLAKDDMEGPTPIIKAEEAWNGLYILLMMM
jgi:hypothetical protein